MALTQGINTNLTKEEYDAFIREQQRALAASKSATGTSPSGTSPSTTPASTPQTPTTTYNAADLAKQLSTYFLAEQKAQTAYQKQLQMQQTEFQKQITSLGSKLGTLSSSFQDISGQWGQFSTQIPQMFQGILTALDVQGQVPGVPSYLPSAYKHEGASWEELFG